MSKSIEANRQVSIVKRASNRYSSAAVLSGAGINFESRNDGAHLIVTHGGLVFDFWPGTGKWCQRGTADYRRGVFGLLKRLGKIASVLTTRPTDVAQ